MARLTQRDLAGCLVTGLSAWLLYSRSAPGLGVYVPLGIPVLAVALTSSFGPLTSLVATLASCCLGIVLAEVNDCYAACVGDPNSLGWTFELVWIEAQENFRYPHRIVIRYAAYALAFAALSLHASREKRSWKALFYVALLGLLAPALAVFLASPTLVSSGVLRGGLFLCDPRVVIDSWGVYKWGLEVGACVVGVAPCWFIRRDSPCDDVPE